MTMTFKDEHEMAGEFLEKIDYKELVEKGFSVLVAVRTPIGNLLSKEHRGITAVCHRFNEVASCRTKLVEMPLFC